MWGRHYPHLPPAEVAAVVLAVTEAAQRSVLPYRPVGCGVPVPGVAVVAEAACPKPTIHAGPVEDRGISERQDLQLVCFHLERSACSWLLLGPITRVRLELDPLHGPHKPRRVARWAGGLDAGGLEPNAHRRKLFGRRI